MDINAIQSLLNNLNIQELEDFNNRAKKINNDSLIAQGSLNSAMESYNKAVELYNQKYQVVIDDTNLAKEIELEVKLLQEQSQVLKSKVEAIESGQFEREPLQLVNEENTVKLDTATGQLKPEYLEEQEQRYKQLFDQRASEFKKEVNEQPQAENTVPPIGQVPQQPTNTFNQPVQPVQQTEQPLQQTAQTVPPVQPMQTAPVQQTVAPQGHPVQPMQQTVPPAQQTVPQPAQPVYQQPATPAQPVVDYNAVQQQLASQVNTVAQEEVQEQQVQEQQAPVQPVQPNTVPNQANVNPNFNWGAPPPAAPPTEGQQAQMNVNNYFAHLAQGTEFK